MAAGKNLQESIEQAIGQINGILKLSSPEEKLKREVQREQMGAMRQLYQDYKANPKAYQMTAHGPVLIDPFQRAERLARMGHTIASTRLLNKRAGAGGATGAFIAENAKRMKAAMAYEQSGGKLPGSGKTVTPLSAPSAVAGAQEEATSVDPDEETAMSDNEGIDRRTAPIPYFDE